MGTIKNFFKKIAYNILTFLAGKKGKPAYTITDETTQFGIECIGEISPSDFVPDGYIVTLSKDNDEKQILVDKEQDISTIVEIDTKNGWKLKSTEPKHRPLPFIQRSTRVLRKFKPENVIVTEFVTAVYGGESLPDIARSESVIIADDVILTRAFVGLIDCLHNSQYKETGISGPELASYVGSEIDWPIVNPGLDMTVGFAVESSVLSRAKFDIPVGYNSTPKSVTIMVRANIFGRICV